LSEYFQPQFAKIVIFYFILKNTTKFHLLLSIKCQFLGFFISFDELFQNMHFYPDNCLFLA